MKLNEHFSALSESYLFATVAQKSAAYAAAHPDKKVIKLSIGDVTLPLAPAVISAMHEAVEEMGRKARSLAHPNSLDKICARLRQLVPQL